MRKVYISHIETGKKITTRLVVLPQVLRYQVGTGLKLANIASGHTSLVGSKCYQYWYQC